MVAVRGQAEVFFHGMGLTDRVLSTVSNACDCGQRVARGDAMHPKQQRVSGFVLAVFSAMLFIFGAFHCAKGMQP